MLSYSVANVGFAVPHRFKEIYEIRFRGALPTALDNEASIIEILYAKGTFRPCDIAAVLRQSICQLLTLLCRNSCDSGLWIRLANVNWCFASRDWRVIAERAAVINRVYAGPVKARDFSEWRSGLSN